MRLVCYRLYSKFAITFIATGRLASLRGSYRAPNFDASRAINVELSRLVHRVGRCSAYQSGDYEAIDGGKAIADYDIDEVHVSTLI